MYAFGPLPKYKQSGRVIGTHQKIDRIARRHLNRLLDSHDFFPDITSILHFEGSRGPDGIKLKSPGRDEPWHFIDPNTMKDTDGLFVAIADHQANLAAAIRERNKERAAFEAAWLAHAVADGLTPAHHDPFEDQVKELRAQDHRKEQVLGRIIMTGAGSRTQFVRNNWKYWGAKGVMTNHTLFEAGVAVAAKPLQFASAEISSELIARVKKDGFLAIYQEMIREVDSLGMYDEFKRKGWTRSLGQQTTRRLMPIIIQAVVLAWYDAYLASEEANV